MIDPGLLPFIDIWNQKWARAAPDATPGDRRELAEAIGREMRMPTPPDVDAEAVHWVDTPASRVRLRVFRHRDGGAQPGLVYMHGGSWIQGSPETHWDITARIASWNRQTVLSVDYAKSPEHPFPAALEQCTAVLGWTFENARALGVDPGRIAIGGDSAGGNLAAAVTLKMRGSDRQPHAQLLIYPPTAFVRNRPSYLENADGPIIRVADMPSIDAMYCPDPNDLRHPLAAPLLATDHSRLPPAFIAVAEHDPLRDDGIAYADALRRAGVPVDLDPGTGLIHGYLRAIGHCDACGAALERMCAWLARQEGRRAIPVRKAS
ncbi:MAG: alpha/beta hydrolase [Burkholderiaceae bacterium]|jgi:acetyl esterase/lipase|nr:alpha/beta hydrolase [Burkholderiaceae bacterium]MEB2319915.1 alpha/beta hydrolase [Pseudomonadota bacterium]